MPFPYRQRGRVNRRQGGILWIEPHGADHSLGEVGVEERLHCPGVRAGTREHDAVGWVPPVHGEQLPGDRLVVALLLLPDPVVVGVLTPAAGPVLVAVEAFTASAVGADPGHLARFVGGHLEEPGLAPIEHHGEQPAKLVFHRRELAYQRAGIHREAGAMDHRKGHGLEQVDSLAGKYGQALRVRQIPRIPEELLHPVQVSAHFIGDTAVEPEPRQGLDRRFHPVFDLDQILAARAVARLELQIAGDYPMIAGLDPGQPFQHGRKLPRGGFFDRGTSGAVRRRSARGSSHKFPRAHAGSRRACSRPARNPAWLV